MGLAQIDLYYMYEYAENAWPNMFFPFELGHFGNVDQYVTKNGPFWHSYIYLVLFGPMPRTSRQCQMAQFNGEKSIGPFWNSQHIHTRDISLTKPLWAKLSP